MSLWSLKHLGYDVRYQLVKSLTPSLVANSHSVKVTLSKIQLEYLCKKLWIELIKKQIDKLQTNHQGVFVLGDRAFKWLKMLPADQTDSRVMEIKVLALLCGFIRCVLGSLGITNMASCDFLEN